MCLGACVLVLRRASAPQADFAWFPRAVYRKLPGRKEVAMPIFEYCCTECGDVTEFLEKAGVRGKHACAACGSTATEKAFSTFAAHAQQAAPACPNRGQCASQSCPMAQ